MKCSRYVLLTILASAGLPLAAAEPAATAVVTVDPSVVLGTVKPMHAVNNGPTVKKPGGDQKRGNFEDYKAARLPFARTHDSINCVSGGAHCCDISAIFPDFGADENDPKNYDFVFTDHYLDAIRRAGTEVFFRLGQTIEHGPKKYGVLPPKDYAKWARICEHVIRHYNEGWGWGVDQAPTTQNIAWSNQFNIVYWEVWNEPDLYADVWQTNPRTWGGSEDEFFRFYETAAKHLKGEFPNLKIGGPALAGVQPWADRFMGYCKTNSVPLDFFSWHSYESKPEAVGGAMRKFRAMLDRHGFSKTESILNEWNYVRGWGEDFVYSLRSESGDLCQKGAAFVAATMAVGQAEPVDMLMYYDARSSTVMNGMFERTTLWPQKPYYAFYAWSRLADHGAYVASAVSETMRGKPSENNFFASAACGKDGSGAVFVVRYSDDDNVCDTATVTVRVPGKNLAGVRCHLTDLVRTYTEVPVEPNPDGSANVRMQPNSFVLIEW